MSVCIGALEFPSAKEAHAYTKALLTELGAGTIISTNHPKYQFFVDLLNNHEDVPRKVGSGIVSFGIQHTARDRNALETYILRTDRTTETFSWASCSKRKFMTVENILYNALRQAIQPQINEFRAHNPSVCQRCKGHTRCDVDHKSPTFYEIVKCFLAMPPLHPVPNTFEKQAKTNANIFRPQDAEFVAEWYAFHKNKANLQFLCESCHKQKTAEDKAQSSEIAQLAKDTSLPLG